MRYRRHRRPQRRRNPRHARSGAALRAAAQRRPDDSLLNGRIQATVFTSRARARGCRSRALYAGRAVPLSAWPRRRRAAAQPRASPSMTQAGCWRAVPTSFCRRPAERRLLPTGALQRVRPHGAAGHGAGRCIAFARVTVTPKRRYTGRRIGLLHWFGS